MARKCELSGVGPFTGNNVSHSNIKTRRRWLPNLKNKAFFVPELGKNMVLSLTSRSIRTVDKQGGITNALLKAKEENLSPRLKKVRSHIIKQRKGNPSKKETPTTAASS